MIHLLQLKNQSLLRSKKCIMLISDPRSSSNARHCAINASLLPFCEIKPLWKAFAIERLMTTSSFHQNHYTWIPHVMLDLTLVGFSLNQQFQDYFLIGDLIKFEGDNHSWFFPVLRLSSRYYKWPKKYSCWQANFKHEVRTERKSSFWFQVELSQICSSDFWIIFTNHFRW